MIPFILFLVACQDPKDAFQPPKSLGPGLTDAINIQRTMHLLASSTKERPHRVKILFYGQSITEQKWWTLVLEDLKLRFPHADLRAVNRAVGGFSSQLLVKLVESDLAALQPDLIIFHVYGSHIEYENILKYIRRHTTAEIMLQTDHVTRPDDLAEETNGSKLTPRNWNAWMNYSFLPRMASTYQTELVSVRRYWMEYLRENRVPPQALLTDAVHLNDKGCQLMAAIVKAHLKVTEPRFPSPAEAWNTLQPITPEMWNDNVMEIAWTGAHLDLQYFTGMSAQCRITLDGKPLSEAPPWMIATRATNYPGSIWPCLLRSRSNVMRLEEDWRIELTEIDQEYKNIRFKLHGSITGDDGTGSTAERFISKSGRVVIEPDDWGFQYARRVFGAKLEKGFTIHWQVKPYEKLAQLGAYLQVKDHVYSFPPTPVRSDLRPIETIALVGGLPPSKHTLRIELVAGERKAFHSVMIRNPPLASTNEKHP